MNCTWKMIKKKAVKNWRCSLAQKKMTIAMKSRAITVTVRTMKNLNLTKLEQNQTVKTNKGFII